MVTPYTSDLKIDVPAYHKILEWHLHSGSHGIYAMCLSSEMFLLSTSEQQLLIEEAISVTAGAVPIVVTGNLAQEKKDQIEFIQWAHRAGAQAVMLVIPNHLEDQDAIESYFMDILEQTNPIPLGLYECPYPKHRLLSAAVVGRLASTGRFVTYKETSCYMPTIHEKISICEGYSMSIMQANVPYLLEALEAGCTGSMNVVSNWLPDLTADTYNAFKDGNIDLAVQLHQLLCTFEMMQRSIHPSGVKYLMSLRGLPITERTRRAKKLTAEERKSLDIFATHWLNQDGALKSFTLLQEVV